LSHVRFASDLSLPFELESSKRPTYSFPTPLKKNVSSRAPAADWFFLVARHFGLLISLLIVNEVRHKNGRLSTRLCISRKILSHCPATPGKELTVNLNFLSAPGEVAALMRTHDWSTSPLGHPTSWPGSLRTIVGFMLNSKFPMFLAWGEELACVYNDAYAEILGKKHPAAIGQGFQNVWSEIWDDIYPLVRQALSGEPVFHENLPLTMLRKGFEEQTWFTFSYSPVQDESGAIRGMCVTCIETTSQVLSERHRLEENQRLHALFQQAPGFMAVVREPSHVFELANNAYLQLVGHRNLIGKPVREALPELEGQGLFELLDQVYSTGEPYVGRSIPVSLQRTPDGELEERFVDFVYQPIKDHSRRVTGIFAEGSDVTEGVRATQALRDSEERLRQLANTIPHLAWMANPDGFVHWYNDRWYKYTGLTLEEPKGWEWKSLFLPHDLPVMLEKWRYSLETGQPYEVTVPMLSATGEYRTFYINAAPLRDGSGKIIQWFGTNTDVTDLKKLQDELQEANRRKDEFLAMLAHELRNPLAPISTAAEVLKLAQLDERRIRHTSNIITRQVSHMTELIDDLLDVSRVTRGLVMLQEEALDLKGIIADAIEQVNPFISSRGHQLEMRLPDGSIVVKGDRTRLTQILANVINNAAKYTPEKGHIAVSVKSDEREIQVSVADNGIGIDQDLLPHIFDLFSQAKRSPDRSQGGLGLGLALVKSLVELHGGTVSAYSRGVGKGSTFIIRLPKISTAIEERDNKSNEPTEVLAGSSIRMLVVDDNVDAAHTLAMLLEALGHQVHVEHSGQQALQRARSEKPEMLFLDIGLPDIDGYELARSLRQVPETSHSVLIAVTGYGQQEDKDRAVSAGFNHHLVKPVSLNTLERLIEDIAGAGKDRK
jgi:PAS domain S-box-containing protein